MIQKYFFAVLDWCKIAISIENKSHAVLFKEGEIWWCSVGMNIGVEIFGKGEKFARPVIIFKKFNQYSFLGIPLTTQPKEGIWYFPFVHNNKKQFAVFSQIRTFDSNRLINKLGEMDESSLREIERQFLKAYLSENNHPASTDVNAGIGGLPQ